MIQIDKSKAVNMVKNKEGVLKNTPVYNPSDLLFDLQSVIEFYNR